MLINSSFDRTKTCSSSLIRASATECLKWKFSSKGAGKVGWGGGGGLANVQHPGGNFAGIKSFCSDLAPESDLSFAALSLRANSIVDELRDVGPHHRPGHQLSAGNTDRDVSVPYTLTHAHTQQYSAYPPTTVGADPQGLNTANKSTDTFRSQNDFRL